MGSAGLPAASAQSQDFAKSGQADEAEAIALITSN
jgi:hypothetical protein